MEQKEKMDTSLVCKTLPASYRQECHLALRTLASVPERSEDGVVSVSIFSGEVAHPDKMMECVARLQNAFPTIDQRFCMELVRMATKIMMSAERLEAAVDNVILNHHYPTLTIADVLGFDVRLRLYSGMDVLRLRKQFPHPDFLPYTVDGVKYWVERTEAARLRVKLDEE